MKTFTIKQQRAVLRSLIRHWWPALTRQISRAIVLSNRYFTDAKIRAAVRALALNQGDLDGVKKDFQTAPENWHQSFFVWADKVKGGAL